MGNYGLSDDRLPMSYIDDFSLGDIAYGEYPPFNTNTAGNVPYMDDYGIGDLGNGEILYRGTWEDENMGQLAPNETARQNQMLLWGGLAIAALLFLGGQK